MSGYMVRTWFGGTHSFYMVNSETPEAARAEVDRLMGQPGAEVLSSLSEDTLKHYDVQPGKPRFSFGMLPHIPGVVQEVTGSVFDIG
jgi:hypothetical protein